MTKDVEITLVENSTAGNPPKTFTGQIVEIVHEADTVVTGIDGHTSISRHPSKILWFGRTTRDLANITNVKIVGNNGDVLIDGELNTNYGASDTAIGVEFYVL